MTENNRIAKMDDKPVAWRHTSGLMGTQPDLVTFPEYKDWSPLYTAPPQAKLHAQFQAGVDSMIESAEYQKAAAFQLGREEGLTQLQAAIDQAREEAAKLIEPNDLDFTVEYMKGFRDGRKVAAYHIRALIGKPLGDSHDNG